MINADLKKLHLKTEGAIYSFDGDGKHLERSGKSEWILGYLDVWTDKMDLNPWRLHLLTTKED